MSDRVTAEYYDGITSGKREALVRLREWNSLEVTVEDRSSQWPLEHPDMKWERNERMLRVTFGEEPRRVLLITDHVLIGSFASAMQRVGRRGIYDRTLGIVRKGPIYFLLIVIALVIGGYFWVLPFAAERMALWLPRSFDRTLGEAGFNTIGADLRIDEEKSRTLQEFADRIDLADEQPLTFHVAEDDQVNAFALPGGDIVVFTGILDRMDSPEQLGALLAHEAMHVQERHSMRMIVRGMAGNLFLILLVGDANGAMGILLENAHQLRNLGYSRNLETEADLLGVEKMHEAGMDPSGMAGLMELLQREEHDLSGSFAFLSSHPLTAERIKAAKQAAEEYPAVDREDPVLNELFERLVRSEEAVDRSSSY